MLVLSRKTSQEIVIPDRDITIKVASIGSQNVKLLIDAPRDCKIVRGELKESENDTKAT